MVSKSTFCRRGTRGGDTSESRVDMSTIIAWNGQRNCRPETEGRCVGTILSLSIARSPQFVYGNDAEFMSTNLGWTNISPRPLLHHSSSIAPSISATTPGSGKSHDPLLRQFSSAFTYEKLLML